MENLFKIRVKFYNKINKQLNDDKICIDLDNLASFTLIYRLPTYDTKAWIARILYLQVLYHVCLYDL